MADLVLFIYLSIGLLIALKYCQTETGGEFSLVALGWPLVLSLGVYIKYLSRRGLSSPLETDLPENKLGGLTKPHL